VTDAERRAMRGHGPLAICLPEEHIELAWSLERQLFDHGYSVHVIHAPDNLHQAVSTILEAGLIAIVVPAVAADWDVLADAVPDELLVRAGNLAEGVDSVLRLGRSDGPLTGGDGI